ADAPKQATPGSASPDAMPLAHERLVRRADLAKPRTEAPTAHANTPEVDESHLAVGDQKQFGLKPAPARERASGGRKQHEVSGDIDNSDADAPRTGRPNKQRAESTTAQGDATEVDESHLAVGDQTQFGLKPAPARERASGGRNHEVSG